MKRIRSADGIWFSSSPPANSSPGNECVGRMCSLLHGSSRPLTGDPISVVHRSSVILPSNRVNGPFKLHSDRWWPAGDVPLTNWYTIVIGIRCKLFSGFSRSVSRGPEVRWDGFEFGELSNRPSADSNSVPGLPGIVGLEMGRNRAMSGPVSGPEGVCRGSNADLRGFPCFVDDKSIGLSTQVTWIMICCVTNNVRNSMRNWNEVRVRTIFEQRFGSSVVSLRRFRKLKKDSKQE